MAEQSPYGMWRSPVSAHRAAAVRRPGPVAIAPDGAVWWQETRPDEEGRAFLMREAPPGPATEMLTGRGRPVDQDVGSWLPVGDGAVVASGGGGRLFLFRPSEAPRPLVPAPVDPRGDFYTDLVAGPGGDVWGVRVTRHDGVTVRSLVAVPLDGSLAVRTLLRTTRIVSAPRPSPDGSAVAWIAWEPPLMPWDGTELRIGRVTDGGVIEERVLLGGSVEAVCQPEWASADSLYAMSDRSGWWNPYEVGTDGAIRALSPRAEEFAWPPYEGGWSTYGPLADGRLAVMHGGVEQRLDLLTPEDGLLSPLNLPYDSWRPTLTTRGRLIACVAGAPTSPPSVVAVDVADGRHRVLQPSMADPSLEYAPEGYLATFTGRDGHEVHTIIYPPSNPRYRASGGERVPYLLFLPDGPTTQVTRMLDPVKMFFTSRGIGVAEIWPRGSSGYGRAYREQVFGRWGVADVEDCAVAVRGLLEHWNADPDRLVLRGTGAGAATALGVLADTDLCAAATVYAPIVDLDSSASPARYLRRLAADSTLLRPPTWLERVRRPVLVLQGLQDTVVPAAQARRLEESLRANHVPHASLTFVDEGNVFNRAETIERALNAELSFYGQLLGFEPPDTPRLTMQDAMVGAASGLGWPSEAGQ